VTAVDRAGHVTTAVAAYRMAAAGGLTFDGFFRPLENGVENVVKAGPSVPVKFRILDGGSPVTDPAVVSVRLLTRTCTATGGANQVDEVAPAQVAAGLRYDDEGAQFVLVHRSEKAWANSCRTLRIEASGPGGDVLREEVRLRYVR
jgi:hypothetical protein